MAKLSKRKAPESIDDLYKNIPYCVKKKLIHSCRAYLLVIPQYWYLHNCKGKVKKVWLLIYKDHIVVRGAK